MPFEHDGIELDPIQTPIECSLEREDGCEDCLYEAWERMTFGGVGFHPVRATWTEYLQDSVGRFPNKVLQQTRWVREDGLVTR